MSNSVRLCKYSIPLKNAIDFIAVRSEIFTVYTIIHTQTLTGLRSWPNQIIFCRDNPSSTRIREEGGEMAVIKP